MDELKTLGNIVTILGPVAGTVVAVVYFLRHLAGEAARTEARDARMFAALQQITSEQAEVIKVNTAEIRSLHDLIASKLGLAAAALDQSTRTILAAITERTSGK